jgi:hypothetical protein
MKANPNEPMTCDLFEAAVLDELYGELTPKTSAAVLAHAARCERCGALIRGLHATRIVAALPLAEAPAGLEERVVEAISRDGSGVERRPRRERPTLRRMSASPLLALAAGAVLVAGGAALWLRREETSVATGTVQGQVAIAAPAAAASSAAPEPMQLAVAEPPSEPPETTRSPEVPTARQLLLAKPSRAAMPKAATELALADKTFAATPPALAPAAPAPAAAPAMRARSTESVDVLGETPYVAADPVGRPTESPARSSGSDAVAELQAARHTRDAEGCAAALPLFERIARGASGSPNGYAALFDSAMCHEATGDYSGARARLEVLSRVEAYRSRAREELVRIGAQPGR